MKTAVLLDVSAIMYRSYYAYINLRTNSEHTGATFGFLNALLGVIKEFKPDYIMGAFDVTRSSLERKKIYNDYKINRKPMPDDLVPQIKRIEELLDIFSIKRVKIEGHEADDVLGSYANKLSLQNIKTYIITGDKDLSQVLDKNISIALIGKSADNKRFRILENDDDVVKQLGVVPAMIPDLFGLIGDSSDGIPGIRKVGPKKAISMLDLYKNLEGIYENIENLVNISGIGEGLVKNIIEDKELAFLSRKLAIIKTDINTEFNLEDMSYKENLTALIDFCRELNFKSYIKRYTLELEKDINNNKIKSGNKNLTLFNNIEIEIKGKNNRKKQIYNLENIKKLTKELENSKKVALYANEKGVVIITHNSSNYISFDFSSRETNITPISLKSLFQVNTKYIIYGYKKLLKFGIDPINIKCDVFIGNYLLTNNTKEEIENLIFDKQQIILKTYSEILKENLNEELSIENNFEYLEKRAIFLYDIGDQTIDELKKENLIKIYNLEIELVKVLFNMENTGVLIDLDYFKSYKEELSNKIDELIPNINREVAEVILYNIELEIITKTDLIETLLTLGKLRYKTKSTYNVYEEKVKNSDLISFIKSEVLFNIDSPKQLGIVLFQLLKFPKIKKESVGVEVLKVLRDRDGVKIAQYILDYRKLTKLQNTYVEAIPKLADKNTRIHTTFNQTGTATGRLSSSTPNLQNIPARSIEGLKIRKGFIAKNNYKLLSLDYSQIELRILAEISKDETLISAYQQDLDLHDLTARKIFDIDKSQEVTSDQRSLAKIVNFSIIYGKTPFGLSSELNISLSEANQYIDKYFREYPRVKELETSIIANAKKNGFVRTLYNRKRIIQGINSSNKNIVKQSERMSVNSVIQGTAADVLKFIMLNLNDILKNSDDIKMILQVHDELIFEVKSDKVEKYSILIKDIMENSIKLNSVKLKVNSAIGNNWSEVK